MSGLLVGDWAARRLGKVGPIGPTLELVLGVVVVEGKMNMVEVFDEV